MQQAILQRLLLLLFNIKIKNMEIAYIKKELETLLNEFKTKVTNHFDGKEFQVTLTGSDFDISKKGIHELKGNILAICKKNPDGQIVCTL